MKKKLIYMLFGGILALHTACVDDKISDMTPGDGSAVTLSIGLTLPDAPIATRVLENVKGDDSDIIGDPNLKLYVFVFEDSGDDDCTTNYLREVAYGDRIGEVNTETYPTLPETDPKCEAVHKRFSVTLDGTSENAIIHIVATADPDFATQIEGITDRSEAGIFSGGTGLYTSGRYDAYWKRIPLGCKLSSTEQQNIQKQLSHVKMVRNYAKVSLNLGSHESITETGFELKGYILVNLVDCGYVAAYSATNGFIDFDSADYATLTAKYSGFRHPLSHRQHRDDYGDDEENPDWLQGYATDEAWNMDPKYTFERPYQTQHRTFMVAKISNETDTRFVKLEIGNVNTNAIPGTGENNPMHYDIFDTYNLLRNIEYQMTITQFLSKNIGYSSLADAIVAPPANNVSTSVETRSLLNISDGIDRMEVNQTTFVIVDEDVAGADAEAEAESKIKPYPEVAELKWRYFTNYRNGSTADNTVVRWDYPSYAFLHPNDSPIIAAWSKDGNDYYQDGAPSGNQSLGTFTANDSNGDWSGFYLKFKTPTDTPVQQTIRLYKPGGLSRDITFILRKRWDFVNDADLWTSNIEIYPGFYSYFDDYGKVITNDPIIGTKKMEPTMKEMRDWIGLTPREDEGKEGFWNIGSQRGARLTVAFELPADLPEAIFPLEFKIGADRQNIENAYEGNAVVTSGKSLFEGDPDPVGVSRMQFIKTVTWDEYNGTGDYGSKGSRIITARFLTTTDPYPISNSTTATDESETRIRVYNPYFKMGEATFYRNSYEAVVDPTCTEWYWNFSHSEWVAFVNPAINGTPTETESGFYTMNDLRVSSSYYAGECEDSNTGSSLQPYTDSNDPNYGRRISHVYDEIGHNYLRIGDGSNSNPAFKFPVRIGGDKFKGTLTINATPDKAREYKSAGNYNGNYNPQGYYLYYDRDVYMSVLAKNADGQRNEYKLSDSNTNYKGEYISQYTSGLNNVLPIRTITFNLEDFNVPENATVEEIRIWSTKTEQGHFTEGKAGVTGEYEAGTDTRFYAIGMSLDK